MRSRLPLEILYTSEVELLQEAFYHFDEDKDFYLTLDELRAILTSEDAEPMPDVCDALSVFTSVAIFFFPPSLSLSCLVY